MSTPRTLGGLIIEETVKVARGQIMQDFISYTGGLGLCPICIEKRVKSFNHKNMTVLEKSVWWL